MLVPTRKIGRTNLSVTQFGFGTAPLGGMYRTCPREVAMHTLDAAWEAGIRFFDTAPWYGYGLAERRIGDFLRDKEPSSYVLSTKVGRLQRPVPPNQVPDHGFVNPLPFETDYDYSYDGIMRSVEFSYARLGLSRIDMLFVHDIGVYTHGAERNSFYLGQLFGSGLKALEQLKSTGTIEAFGIGVNEVPVCLDVLREAHLDCILLAGRYTLLDRTAAAELLPLCETRQTSLVVGGVFNSGILATGAVEQSHFDYMPATFEIKERVAAMEKTAACQGVSLSQAALQFPLQNKTVASVLFGTADPAILAVNMDQKGRQLRDEEFGAYDVNTLVAPPLGSDAVRV